MIFIKKTRLFFLVLICLLFNFSFVNSIGVFDNLDNFVYYTNNEGPTISLNISSPLEDIYILYALLRIEDVEKKINFTNRPDRVLGMGDGFRTYSFTLDEFGFNTTLRNKKDIYFELKAVDVNGDDIIPIGDKNKFSIIFDDEPPSVLNLKDNETIYLSYKELKDMAVFDEKILKVDIFLNGKSYNIFNVDSKNLYDFKEEIDLELTSEMLSEGVNDAKLVFYDLAGNKGEISFNIIYKSKDLELSLLTSKEDPNLKYFFDPNYLPFFKNVIYTSENNFTLKIKANKEADCYYLDSLLNFEDYNEFLLSKASLMNSEGDGIYSQKISIRDIDPYKQIYVVCQDKNFKKDFIYLSESMGVGKRLIKIQKYTEPKIKILSILPDSLVSYSPFDLVVKTDNEGICSYELNGEIKNFDELDYFSHNTSIGVGDGTYNIKISCFDKLGRTDFKNVNIKVDTKNGVKIISYSPKYTMTSSANVKIIFSEDAECKYSNKQESITSYGNLTLITGNGVSKNMAVSNLIRGKNDFYIYCNKDSFILENKIDIIYDDKGPIISNFSFVNNGFESDYLFDFNKIEFKFESESLIPMDHFEVTLYDSESNEVYRKEFNRNSYKIRNKFENVSKLKLVGYNIINSSSNVVEKELKIDNIPPSLSFNKISSNSLSIVCIDEQSGCGKILYGLSELSFDCLPNIKLKDGENVNFSSNMKFVCAKAFDKVGNYVEDRYQVNLLDINSSDFDINYSSNNNSNGSVFDYGNEDIFGLNESDLNESDYELNKLENIPEEDNSTLTYSIIGAIILLLIGAGSGGYYAYKKGYLNKQLEKLGLKPYYPKGIGTNSKSRGVGGVRFKTPREISKGGKYDNHLNKLNSFIDKEISKGDSLFSKFDGDSDGKKGSSNSNINKRKDISALKSKEDLDDDFYNLSKKSSNVLDIDKEKEEFENYLKKKENEETSGSKEKDLKNKK